MSSNIHRMPDPPKANQSGGSNGGNNIRERVAVLEAELKHLATGQQIEEVKTLIEKKEATLLRWLISMVSASVIALIVVLIRTFIS